MVKLAKDMVRSGKYGKVRKIVVKYPQGWLATALEKTGQMQAAWRTDPKQSGGSGCGGDIGTHAENLAEYITGLKITDMCADLTAFVKGRKLDDDVNCLLKFTGGAKGILHASQISVGEEKGGYLVEIQDTGCGISPENLKKLFNPFFTTKERGSGLGLSIVKKIVEGHSGDIAIESRENQGTKVTVRLPKQT